MLDPLSALAVKYGSDKWSSKHSYTAWYYEQFKDRRASVRKVVEIGVGEGASLRMWRDFFQNAMIYGADNQPSRVWSEERIQVFACDQAKRGDLENLIAQTGVDIDLFIDDGSHWPDDQQTTCERLMDLLSPGVTYVIEDVAFARWPGSDRFKADMPYLEHRNRYDNRLVVVKHG